jgi:hypothetical protein
MVAFGGQMFPKPSVNNDKSFHGGGWQVRQTAAMMPAQRVVEMNKMIFAFNCYRYSISLLLIITAGAKLVSSGSGSKILDLNDPIFQIPFQYMLWGSSLMELAVSLVCLSNRQTWVQATAIAWLSTNFLMYRIGLWLVDYRQPCSCMGRLTDGLHISAEHAEIVMKVILTYLLVGSYATLMWLWMNREKPNAMKATN